MVNIQLSQRWLFCIAFLLSSFAVRAHGNSDSVKLNIRINSERNLVYDLSYLNKSVILESSLGINIDNQNLGRNTQILESLKDNSGMISYKLMQSDGTIFYLDTHVFADGVALRYRIPTNGPKCIYNEQTSFTFPSQTRVWYASGPFQYGWIQHYQDRLIEDVDGELLAPPATFHLSNGIYAAITEANLFNFHGAVLFGSQHNKVHFGYVENKGHLESEIKTGLPDSKFWHEVVRNVPWVVYPKANCGEIVTPWRVLMLASDLNGLVNNKIQAQVCDQPDKTLFPDGAKTEWIKPGRASFTWLVEGDDRLSVANHKKYIDGCSELGIESVVVDDGWELWQETEKNANGKNKWQMMKELVDYARAKNVNIWVWRSSSPRFSNKSDIGLVDSNERKEFMQKCAEIGVKGLKIDFFHSENLFTVNLMENILKEAAKNKLMVIFHGVNKPTGDSYTYPNLLAKEAVRGLECVGAEQTWAPGPAWPYHNTVLPFTRWLAGPADYTPLNFRKFCPESTTFAHQLSSIYMYTSPMLIFAADIEDMLSCPGRSFIESVPVVWDETKVLHQSEIGKLAALARRKGDVWYLTVLNGENAQLFKTTINFLPKGHYTMEIARDLPGNRKMIEVKKMKIRSGQEIKENLMSGGGFVARIIKVK